jgi:hypothetical protein
VTARAVRTPGPAAQVAVRAGGVVVAALVLAALVLPWRPPTLCFLRSVTGVPCPFCGGTTAFVRLGEGRPLAALAASPLAVLGAPVFVAWPVVRERAGRWAASAGRPVAVLTVLAVLAASWAWQLHRVL